jgi:hypothetical protein
MVLFRLTSIGHPEQNNKSKREAGRRLSFRRWPALSLLLVLTMLVIPQEGVTQLNSSVSSVALTATLLESLTVVAAPSAVAFTLASGSTTAGSTAVSVTTVWTLGITRTNVNLYTSFASSTAALTDGSGDDIPSANVLGQMTTGLPTTFTAFTQTGPFGGAGASLELFSQSISVTNLTSTRTDNLNLEIDLTSLPNLPAGVYTGTLNIQAQAL